VSLYGYLLPAATRRWRRRLVAGAPVVASRAASGIAERWADRDCERQAGKHACENFACADLLHALPPFPPEILASTQRDLGA
jgi:hypothetical protein